MSSYAFQSAELIDDGRAVALVRPGGSRVRFHATWLRDNALEPGTRAAGNGQRLITMRDLAADISVSSVAMSDNGEIQLEFLPDNVRTCFSAAWLSEHAYDRERSRTAGWTSPGIATWDASTLREMPDKGRGHALPAIDFSTARDDRDALTAWLAAVRRYGVAMMQGGPVESGAPLKVAALFGFVRETNYGRCFDVRAQVNPSNLAYTTLGLQAHTDNPYRDPAPTMQLLYCLENSCRGGDSIVVDGFRAAHRLRDESPRSFELLAKYCARFEYAGAQGVRLRARKPMIELAPDGELVGIRFNNRAMAPVVDVPYDDMPAYYEACRRFSSIIDEPAMAVSFSLSPGDCFIVDNTRVLHAREAYSGTGSRWLQGCYPDRDGLLSHLAAIEQDSEEPTVTGQTPHWQSE